jgi:hypothetical protein
MMRRKADNDKRGVRELFPYREVVDGDLNQSKSGFTSPWFGDHADVAPQMSLFIPLRLRRLFAFRRLVSRTGSSVPV